DVFIDANTIYFSGPPGPNPGTTFIVTGYIYPGGTLAGNPQVAPRNPIGEWTCRGTFTRNASEVRPEVFTIQEFYLPDDTTAIASKLLLDRSLMKTFKVLSWYVSTALLIGTLAHADVVTEWNSAALDAIRAGHTPPPIASRSLAIVHVSIYDAVNGITRTHEPYLVQSAVPASASREAAASAAAHDALVNLFPAAASSFNALHAAIL